MPDDSAEFKALRTTVAGLQLAVETLRVTVEHQAQAIERFTETVERMDMRLDEQYVSKELFYEIKATQDSKHDAFFKFRDLVLYGVAATVGIALIGLLFSTGAINR